jgi:hypothetical protein
MKRAKQKHKLRKPRNPLVTAVITRSAGAHQRRDKRASRARQKALLKRHAEEQ